MSERSEIEALKASLRGAAATSATLAVLQGRVEALESADALEDGLLQELARAASAHAVASAAVRGLVETIVARRGKDARS